MSSHNHPEERKALSSSAPHEYCFTIDPETGELMAAEHRKRPQNKVALWIDTRMAVASQNLEFDECSSEETLCGGINDEVCFGPVLECNSPLSWLHDASPLPGRKIAGCSEIRISDFNIKVIVQYESQMLTTSQILDIVSHGHCNPEDLILSLDGEVQSIQQILRSEYARTNILTVAWNDEPISLGQLVSSGDWATFLMVCLVIVEKYIRLVLQLMCRWF